jgi:hypothetical protein
MTAVPNEISLGLIRCTVKEVRILSGAVTVKVPNGKRFNQAGAGDTETGKARIVCRRMIKISVI